MTDTLVSLKTSYGLTEIMLHRYVKLLEISQFSNKFSFRILIRKDTHSGCNFCSGGGGEVGRHCSVRPKGSLARGEVVKARVDSREP